MVLGFSGTQTLAQPLPKGHAYLQMPPCPNLLWLWYLMGDQLSGLLKNARVALGAAGEERRVLPKCAAVYPGFSESLGCSLSLLCLRTDTV